ncbi:hypothetical protein GOODEAATRI_010040 [Goodea atripinnis]|uniref:Uncharacterized protein n=1 Tax=Goodea atripinnis TaxID=208336 RepID=A0ABV0PCV1_9TELE
MDHLSSNLLSDGRAPPKVEPGRPTEEAHFSCLQPGSDSFSQGPYLRTIGKGCNMPGEAVNPKLHLSAQLLLYMTDWINILIRGAENHLSISCSTLPSLRDNTRNLLSNDGIRSSPPSDFLMR